MYSLVCVPSPWIKHLIFGLQNTKPKGVKDIDTDFAEIPWQAMILKESSKSLLCGGAIIGDGVILTTASCVQG